MKKVSKISAVLLCATILFSSCIGSFGLTKKVQNWNESLGDKWTNELVFAALHIVPVYPFAIFADLIVCNTVEFWTGSNPVARNVGETIVVKNGAGENVEIVSTENGYKFSNGTNEIELVFNEADNSWNAVNGEETVTIVKFDELSSL